MMVEETMEIVRVVTITAAAIETTLILELEGLTVVTARRMAVAPIGAEIVTTKPRAIKMQRRSATVWVEVIVTVFQLRQLRHDL